MKKYSKKWMQTFVKGEFPKDNNIIIEKISKHAFEVESVEEIKNEKGEVIDSLFEIKVLPNRVADAFNIYGMAKEWATVFDLELNDLTDIFKDISKFERNDDYVQIENNATRCYFGISISIDKQIETPSWIKDIIEKSGGRSINSLVDLTNLMLYSFGQPTHVFDQDKLNGKIITRLAKKGEKITLLDGKVLELSENDNLITDEKNILALAGIKGGKDAEVDKNSVNAFFEIANFSSDSVRKSSIKQGVRTDASKIYENGLSVDVTEDVLIILTNTILEVYPNAKINFISKKYSKNFSHKNNYIDFSLEDVKNISGVEISESEVENILRKLRFEFKKIKLKKNEIQFSVKPSKERLDINIKEDVLEEILRIYGFDNIPSVPIKIKNTTSHADDFVIENIIRKMLIEKGYSEIFNYAFVEKGDIKVLLPLGEDKAYLRNNLTDGAIKAFEKNYNYLHILEEDKIKFFEIGSVFLQNGEDRRLVICDEDNKKKSKNLQILENLILDIENKFNIKINIINKSEKPAIIEISVNNILEEIYKNNSEEKVKEIIKFEKVNKSVSDAKYKRISVYPFISRDIAVWVPENYLFFENLKLEIEKLNLQNMERIYKFDEFTKTDENGSKKTSIAFRIIFQSYDRTLVAEEVEVEMQKVYEYLKENNFEIR